MSNMYRVKALVAALAMTISSAAMASTPGVQGSTVAIKHAVRLGPNDVTVGPLVLTQPMHIVVALRLRNKSQLDALLANARRTPMSSAQFEAKYSPTQAQAEKVADFLVKSGFTNVTIAPNRLLVSGDAPVAFVQSAFKTSMVHVHTHDGRDAYANASDVAIPIALQGIVQSVLGLQNVHIAHTMNVRAGSLRPSSTQTFAITGHNPTEFASIYGAVAVPAASTISVGIITAGSMTNVLNDLSTFTKNNNLPAVATQVVGNGGSDTSGDAEWDLDSQSIVGMSGGVEKLIFYTTPTLSDAGLTSDYNAAVAANMVKVINVSIGEDEADARQAGTASAQDSIFEQAVAQGQTFSVASGDVGANQCGQYPYIYPTPCWPATSQYVVAVGGTLLSTSGRSWGSETVWNDPTPPPTPPCGSPQKPCQATGDATGGGPSTFEPMPIWQQGVGQNAGQNTRGIPDIAFDADPSSGAQVIVHGQLQQWGGTSLASPLFVGVWARLLAAHGAGLGFAAPYLYQLPPEDFHDVTQGNNNGETAAPGWDYTTGFGSMLVQNTSYDLRSYAGYNDVNGAGKSDLLWIDPSTSSFGYWIMNGATVVQTYALPVTAGYWIGATGDFSGDGKSDVIWTSTANDLYLWTSTGTSYVSQYIGTSPNGSSLVGAGDIDGDRKSDLLWIDPTSHTLSYWIMSGANVLRKWSIQVTAGYWIGAIGDFNGDGKSDLVWTSANRDLYLWTSNGTSFSSQYIGTYPSGWSLIGAADIDGDGKADLLWVNPTTHTFAYWIMNGASITRTSSTAFTPGYWIASIGDFNGDGKADIVWTSRANDLYVWLGNGTGFTSQNIEPYPAGWQPVH